MEWVRLGDVASKITKGTTPTSVGFNFIDEGINFIKAESISENGEFIENKFDHISDKCNEKLARSQLQENDILFSIAGVIGRTAIVKKEILPANTNQALAIIRVPSGIFDYSFLMHALKSPLLIGQYEKQKQGVAQINLSLQNVCDFRIPKLSLEEQHQIAAVLDKVTDLIAQRRAQLDKLDLLVKSRFVEMFGDETEFSRWPCCKVGDVADICVGVVIKPTQYYADTGIPAFRSLNIGELYVKDSDWVYFTEEGHKKNTKSIIRENDILVVRSGAPGTACVATAKYAGYNAVDIIIAHPDQTRVDPVFLAAFTNMPHGRMQIKAKTGGAAQQHFNVSGYKSLDLILPPRDLQHSFSQFVKRIESSKSTIYWSLDKLKILQKALMQNHFR